MSALTRGQLIASTIKAHPEMDEAVIAAMIDRQIASAADPLRSEIALEARDLREILDHPDATRGILTIAHAARRE